MIRCDFKSTLELFVLFIILQYTMIHSLVTRQIFKFKFRELRPVIRFYLSFFAKTYYSLGVV